MQLFGRARKTQPKDAIIKLRETLLLLEKREAFLQAKAEQELRSAKAHVGKNRRSALMALKRKKQFEDQIDRIVSTRLTIETQVLAIESANVNLETLTAMRQGAEAMKSIHGAMSIEKVDTVMDDIREQMDLATEISDAISVGVGVQGVGEDEELERELEELEQEVLDGRLLGDGMAVPSVAVPAVPAHQARLAEREEEDAELEELRASMAM